MRALRFPLFLVPAALLWLLCAPGYAQPLELPRSLVVEALSVDVPTAFAPVDLRVEDYAVDWLAGSAAVEVQLVPDSLRWARVARFVVVPRALLAVSVRGARGGSVAYAGFNHPLVPSADGSAARAEVPVALISGAAHPVTVHAHGAAGPSTARFALRFAPRPAQRARVLFDSSCSPYGLQAARGAVPDDSLLYVGCRLVRTNRGDDTAATLELYALWDQAGPQVTVEGAPAAPAVDALYTIRVGARPGHVRLAARGRTVVLRYRLPDPLHSAFIGAGVGPYLYSYEDGPVDLDTVISLVTVYAGYSFTPAIRVVYFNAAALHRRGSIDQGLYVWFEQVRMMDERISLNLLLGANVLVYARGDSARARLSLPQGFEFIARDVLGKNRNLTAGAFLYPKISGRVYYNAWLRWGSPAIFGEINYIEWQEPHGEASTRSRALGVSFGAPIVWFL